MSDVPYVLQKNGMYYAHNSCGYVHRVLMAEIYTKEYAENYVKGHDEIRAIPITDLLTDVEEIEEYLERITAMRDCLKSIAQHNSETQ